MLKLEEQKKNVTKKFHTTQLMMGSYILRLK